MASNFSNALRCVLNRRAWPLNLLSWLLMLTSGLFYGRHLPSTVQGLDTGELVLSSWGLFVPHPPGYPLYVWLGMFMTHALPWGSVFWRASALSTLLAGWVLAIINHSTVHRKTALASVVVPLALHPLFWRYALLPDVFMLHGALACMLIYVTRRAPTTPWQLYRAAIVFALGMSNHQTFVFLTPLLLVFAYHFDHPKHRRTSLCAAMVGGAVCLALYASLMTLHVDDLASWGRLQTLPDLAAHMLRQDYGTFRLSPRDTPMGGIRHILQCLYAMMHVGPLVWGILIVAPYAMWRAAHSYHVKHMWALYACLMAYMFGFMPLTNTLHSGVLERFYLFPLVCSAHLASLCLDTLLPWECGSALARRSFWAASIISMGLCAAHYGQEHTALALERETIVEDYATNVLTSMPQGKASILVVHGDTRLHAVRYAQYVLGIRPDVVLLSRTALIPKSSSKLLSAQPLLHLPAFAPQVDEARYVHTLFALNYSAFDVVVSDTRGMDTDRLHLTFTGLARTLSPGTGMEVDWPRVQRMQRRSDTSRLGDSRQFREELDLYAPYAYPYLVAALKAPDVLLARDYLHTALLLVPYCLPAQYELCLREAPDNEAVCQARMQRLRALVGDYF